VGKFYKLASDVAYVCHGHKNGTIPRFACNLLNHRTLFQKVLKVGVEMKKLYKVKVKKVKVMFLS
jgi:hypothetical protein